MDGRAVAMVVARRHQLLWRTKWTTDGHPNRDAVELIAETANRWTVDFAWTHRDHRRQGIAGLLVRTAAAHLDVAVEDSAWGTPFEPDGDGLARHLCPTVLYVAD